MLLNAIKQLIMPAYALPKGEVYQRTDAAPVTRKEKKDPKEVYVGKNADGATVTTRRFEWDMDGKTDFVPVTAHQKGRKIGDVEPELTAADRAQLATRKPTLSTKAAQILKRAFADGGGAITAKEMAMQTRYSLAYAETARASFVAALSE